MSRASARREKIFRPRAIHTKMGARSIRFGLQAMRKWPVRLKPMNPKEPRSTVRSHFVPGSAGFVFIKQKSRPKAAPDARLDGDRKGFHFPFVLAELDGAAERV
jgi:hypothetical protein